METHHEHDERSSQVERLLARFGLSSPSDRLHPQDTPRLVRVALVLARRELGSGRGVVHGELVLADAVVLSRRRRGHPGCLKGVEVRESGRGEGRKLEFSCSF